MNRILLIRLRSSSGFSMVEVLVAATVFMVGFSTLVALSSSASSRLSTTELVTAIQLADEHMLVAFSTSDTSNYEVEVSVAGTSLLVRQAVRMENGLVKNCVSVMRSRTQRVVVELYAEYPTPLFK